MSVSYSSRTTPRSSASQGRIRTENSALSAILRENSKGNLAPSSRTQSLDLSAFDVVTSKVDVVNVSNASINTVKQDVQYVVVSKSNASLNTAHHTSAPELSSNQNQISKVSNVSNDRDTDGKQEHPINNKQPGDSARNNSYASRQLKKRDQTDQSVRTNLSRNRSNSNIAGDNRISNNNLHVSDSDATKNSGINSVKFGGETNSNLPANSRQNSYSGVNLTSGKVIENNVEKLDSGDRENTLHDNQKLLHKEHSHSNSKLAQQDTRLSLHSQHDRISRSRAPFRVNTQDQIVPPLDLSGVNLPEPVPLSDSPTFSDTGRNSFEDQNLHASDQNNSILHFSAHDYNQTGRKTYEVESPVLPHVKYSDNFRQGDPDTYRDRQQGPHRIEAHRSDLADDLKVPYPFDTQAAQDLSAREPKPPSPPVQTTPPPNKEPATSLRSSSTNIYAVANPEVQRAQASGSHRQRDHSDVKFDSASKRAPSPSNRNYGGSPVKDRPPTPYAKSPERESLRSPPDWEIPVEQKSREQSNTSKRGLPPQHPPLDTLHSTTGSKPGSRSSKKTKQEDTQSIRRVYVESPSFTKEEEEEYRFVSSRLEDIDDRKQDTVRAMDNKNRGYGGDDNPGNTYSGNRSRKTGSDKRSYDMDRYEDRNQDQYAGRGKAPDEDRGFYKDANEDQHHDINGLYDREKAEKIESGNRYEDRYERLRDERAEYEREPRRDDESDLRAGFGKQTSDVDERDLRKEKEYQTDLKRRIDKQNKKIRQSEKYERTYNKENNFHRDSIEYPQDEREMGFVQDSLEYSNYDRQPDWENPPQNPYQESPGYYPEGYSKQDSKPDFYDPDDVARMEIVNPKAPKYDYVEHNKEDYGKIPKLTYREIVHKKKEEEEKLDHVFITPKVPSKPKKKQKKAQSAQPEHMGYQAPNQYPVGFKPSSAEELWAQRARVLSEKKGSAESGKPSKSASKAVPRWNTNPQVKQPFKFEAPAPLPNQGQIYKPTGAYQAGNAQDQGSYSQNQGGYSTPTRQLQPLENRPAAPVATQMVPTAIKPSSPFRRHMELKPITQEITTEDGQRISVDINLRLISPPPHGVGSPTHQQQLALVPIQETQGQAGDQRGVPVGVPYQMQDPYNDYDAYNPGYQEDQAYNGYQGNMDLLPMDTRYHDIALTADEIAQIDPSGYSRRYQPGSVSFKDEQGSNTDLKSLEEGYAAIYHKMKNKDPSEHPWYKIYNMNDYKKMQREVRLTRGTLGPDLDTESYKDKMEKRHKQFEYARMVMEKNRMELGHKKPPKFPRSPEKQGEEGAKRKTALEYAKNVPKPTVKPRPNQYNSYEVAAQLTPGSNKHRTPLSSKASPPPTQTVDVIDIRTLEQRHLQERQKTDKIRQNMDSVLTQKAH